VGSIPTQGTKARTICSGFFYA